MDTPQHILTFEVLDFKRIKVAKGELSPTGVTCIAGENGAGKSSAIDGLICAITGEAPAVPIRLGATKSKILLKTEDLAITVRFTQTGKYLEVANHEGAVFKSPLTMLTKGRTPVMFDAGSFALLGEKERREELLKVCPVAIDLHQNAKARKKAFEDRTAVNRDVTRLKGTVETLKNLPAKPQDPVSVTELTGELEQLREQEKGSIAKRRDLVEAQNAVTITTQDIGDAELTVARLTRELKTANEKLSLLHLQRDTLDETVKKLTREVQALPNLIPQAEAIKARIAAAEQINAAAEEYKQQANRLADAQSQLTDAEAESEAFTKEIERLDKEKSAAIQAAKFPHPDLSLNDEGVVCLGEIPFSEASTAQQYIVGIMLAAEATPTLRTCFIRHGSLLDPKSMKLVHAAAVEKNIQVVVEVVHPTDSKTIKIVDGSSVE